MYRLILSAVCAAVIALAAQAQEKKGKGAVFISGDLFFTSKGSQPMALEKTYPGIMAALMLTDEQKDAIARAQQETVLHPDVRAAGQKAKGDATDAEREQARKTIADARQRLREAVNEILTADQKALVAAIQKAYEESLAAAKEALGADANPAKGDRDKAAAANARMLELLREEMSRRLERILTPEQRAAVERAALAQLAAEEAARNSKKAKGEGKG